MLKTKRLKLVWCLNFFAAISLCTAVLYLIASLISWDLSPILWSETLKIVTGIAWCFFLMRVSGNAFEGYSKAERELNSPANFFNYLAETQRERNAKESETD